MARIEMLQRGLHEVRRAVDLDRAGAPVDQVRILHRSCEVARAERVVVHDDIPRDPTDRQDQGDGDPRAVLARGTADHGRHATGSQQRPDHLDQLWRPRIEDMAVHAVQAHLGRLPQAGDDAPGDAAGRACG